MAEFDFWNVDEKVSDWIRKELNQWATDMVNGGIDLISDVITSPIDLSEKVPNFEPIMAGTQVIAGMMLVLFLYQRVLGAMYNQTIDAEEVNYAKIIGEIAIAAGLIYSFPILANRFAVIAAELTTWVAGFELEFLAGDELFNLFSLDAAVETGVHLLLLFLLWGVAFIGLAIAGGIRVVMFALGMIISPMVMAAYPVNPGLVKQFCMSMLAVVITQPYQMLCLSLGMGVAAMGGFWGLLGSLAFLCLGIYPVFIKSIFNSTGVGSMAGDTLKMYIYKIVRR